VPLPDPEARWRNDRAPPTRNEIAARLGEAPAAVEVLSGGRANVNVRVDAGRVLRLYRRDVASLAVEAGLLGRPWGTFRVPRVLGRGADFLLLEYVAHGPLRGDAADGVAVGRALAEVHALCYDRPGFLDADLRVARPFADPFDDLRAHAAAALARAAPHCPPGLGERALARLDARAADVRAAAAAATLLHGDFKPSNLRRAADGRLLIFDWEFAYAGPPLLDVGQLLRWGPSPAFVEAFAATYWAGRDRPAGWAGLAATLDLFNLSGLLAGAGDDARRARDVVARMAATLQPSARPPVVGF
jgi:aminoglycoside phosphotransferase (APT) family kinase protein